MQCDVEKQVSNKTSTTENDKIVLASRFFRAEATSQAKMPLLFLIFCSTFVSRQKWKTTPKPITATATWATTRYYPLWGQGVTPTLLDI
jgi:hypothetical protein